MKKSVFLLAAGALALSACTQSEVIEEGVQSNAITFSEVVGKSTRAIDNSNFSNFYVFGYYTKGTDTDTGISVFNEEPVSKSGTGASAVWSYNGIPRYWVKGGNYRFFAYSCDNKNMGSKYGTPSMNLDKIAQAEPVFSIDNYVCHKDKSGESHDLIVAYNNTTTEAKEQGNGDDKNGTVAMNFKHILSKLNIEFESGFPAGYEIAISNIKLINYCDKGTYTHGADSPWGEQARSEGTPEFDFGIEGGSVADATTSTKVTTKCAYVIPFEYKDADVTIQFAIRVTNPALPENQQTILSTVLKGNWQPKWVMGTGYTYKVLISGSNTGMEKIEFTVDSEKGVDGWETPGNDNQVPNITFNVTTGSGK